MMTTLKASGAKLLVQHCQIYTILYHQQIEETTREIILFSGTLKLQLLSEGSYVFLSSPITLLK